MVEGLIALIRQLETLDPPVLWVRFKAGARGTTSKEAEASEVEAIREFRATHPEFASPKQTVVLPVRDVFVAKQLRRREQVILSRLAETLDQALGSEIAYVEPAAEGETAHITISYDIRANGTMYEHTVRETNRLLGSSSRILGLLRGYEIAWTIDIRSGDHNVRRDLTSNAAAAFTLRQKPDDPEWAAYAVMMYSAFHDFSARLRRSLGLKPGPTPNAFSFADAVGRKNDEPQRPLLDRLKSQRPR